MRVTVISAKLQNYHFGRSVFCALSLDNIEKTDRAAAASKSSAKEIEVPKDGPCGSIGVFFDEQDRQKMVRIKNVTPNLPASAHDVRVGDIVTAVNGIAVLTAKQAVRQIRDAVGKVTLRIMRDDTVSETLEESALADTTVRTKMVDSKKVVAWNETFDFVSGEKQPQLFARVYEFSVNKHGQRTGKGFLIGFAAIDLRSPALFCLSSKSAYHNRYVLRQGFSPAAPEVGSLDMEILFAPTEPADEALSRARRDGVRPESRFIIPDVSATSADLGQDLYADLPASDRAAHLQELVTTVQKNIDLEEETRLEFERQLDDAATVEDRERLEENIRESENRRNVLGTRMIQVMSAINRDVSA